MSLSTKTHSGAQNYILSWFTLLLCCLFLLSAAEATSKPFVLDNVCMQTKPIKWEDGVLKASSLKDITNPCKGTPQKYVMMPLDFIDTRNDDFKRNVLIFNGETNNLVRYDPVVYNEKTVFGEDVVDDLLSREADKLGVKYLKESFNGIEGIPGIDKDIFDAVAYSETRRPGEYKSIHPAGTVFLDTLSKEVFKEAYEFLDNDYDVNTAINDITEEPDDPEYQENIAKYTNTIKNLDRIFEQAPRLPRDIVVTRGSSDVKWREKELGDVVEKGYAFATSLEDVASKYGKTTLHILIPKGTRILAWEYLSDKPDLHEVILPRDGRYEIVGRNGKDVYVKYTPAENL